MKMIKVVIVIIGIVKGECRIEYHVNINKRKYYYYMRS